MSNNKSANKRFFHNSEPQCQGYTHDTTSRVMNQHWQEHKHDTIILQKGQLNSPIHIAGSQEYESPLLRMHISWDKYYENNPLCTNDVN
jgi:hypothetical protein